VAISQSEYYVEWKVPDAPKTLPPDGTKCISGLIIRYDWSRSGAAAAAQVVATRKEVSMQLLHFDNNC